MCTVQQDIMITLLKSLLKKELITQDAYDKALEAKLNNTECKCLITARLDK